MQRMWNYAVVGLLSTLWSCGERVHPLTKPWERAIPYQSPPEGLESLDARTCGTCHRKHYEEWKISTHALAWVDPQFQEEIQKDNSPYLCINCHAPLENQQQHLVKGLIEGDVFRPVTEPNPRYDSTLRREGITCAICHVRNGAVIGTRGTGLAPHKVVVDTQFLSYTLCISCHNANAVVTADLVCTFETGDEWASGPYFGKKSCIDCHMTAVEESWVEGHPVRRRHRHYFHGSGIPKFDSIPSVGQDGLTVSAPSIADDSLRPGDTLRYRIDVANTRAGHRVPTGDPERFIVIQLTHRAPSGDTSVRRWRVGEKWQWWPEAKKLADNNFNIGESRMYEIVVPLYQSGMHAIDIRLTKYRMDSSTLKYHKLDGYPISKTFYDTTVRFVVAGR